MTEINIQADIEKVYINEILADLIPGFLASRTQEILEMQKLIDEKNFDGIVKFGHKMKGANLNYGFNTLGQLSSEFELAGFGKNIAQAQTLIGKIRHHLKNIEIVFIKDEE
jgi:HPt (histidine-containing phosphotransfer) domain-containing protein